MNSSRVERARDRTRARASRPEITPWLVLGVLAALAYTVRQPTNSSLTRTAHNVATRGDAGPPNPQTSGPKLRSVSFTPAIWAIIALAGAGCLWFATESWMRGREADALARALTGGDPANAPALIARYGCSGCHTIAGIPGADGQVGPALLGIRQRVFIGGVLPNTAENMINWITNPQAYAPQSAMPATGISSAESQDVTAYLYEH